MSIAGVYRYVDLRSKFASLLFLDLDTFDLLGFVINIRRCLGNILHHVASIETTLSPFAHGSIETLVGGGLLHLALVLNIIGINPRNVLKSPLNLTRSK